MDGLRPAIGDGRDLRHRESFHGVQNEYFAVSRLGGCESGLHQHVHLIGRSDIFWCSDAPVGDHALLGERFIGLMELKFRLVARPHVQREIIAT